MKNKSTSAPLKSLINKLYKDSKKRKRKVLAPIIIWSTNPGFIPVINHTKKSL
jgi:hypothetical protein